MPTPESPKGQKKLSRPRQTKAGRQQFNVWLKAANVAEAKAKGINFSGLMDSLLDRWLHPVDDSNPPRIS